MTQRRGADDESDYVPGETEARRVVRSIIEALSKDVEDGRVLVSGFGDRQNEDAVLEFNNIDQLRSWLVEVGDEQIGANVPFEGGEPVFGDIDSSDIVDELLVDAGLYDFFDQNQLIRSPQQLLAEASDSAVAQGEVVVGTVWGELIAYLTKHPEKMTELSPRKFEELVAELFKDMGYEVELTAASKDGGRDILALRKDAATTLMTHIECKRYAQHLRIGVGVVRALYGVVSAENASHGVVAATTFFTKGAKQFAAPFKHRLSLSDFDKVVSWLKSYQAKRS